jgi:hypothetical protein
MYSGKTPTRETSRPSPLELEVSVDLRAFSLLLEDPNALAVDDRSTMNEQSDFDYSWGE